MFNPPIFIKLCQKKSREPNLVFGLHPITNSIDDKLKEDAI
jgi:hypothetical protein